VSWPLTLRQEIPNIHIFGHINVNKGVFCLIISYLQIKSYNVLNYNNCSTDWPFPGPSLSESSRSFSSVSDLSSDCSVFKNNVSFLHKNKKIAIGNTRKPCIAKRLIHNISN
jgi:hypothetical protein